VVDADHAGFEPAANHNGGLGAACGGCCPAFCSPAILQKGYLFRATRLAGRCIQIERAALKGDFILGKTVAIVGERRNSTAKTRRSMSGR
jgi:hypothetical protein